MPKCDFNKDILKDFKRFEGLYETIFWKST